MGFTDVLKKAFPFISAAASLGGPLGTMAAGVVGRAIGADKALPGTADGISNAIATAMASPEQRAALLKAEQDFQLQMTELGFKNAEDLEAMAAADRANARNREIQTKDWFPKALATVITLCFIGVLTLIIRHGLPESGHDAIMLLLGAVVTAWVGVVTYYFGSSSGSAEKTRILSNVASQK